jgi:hypothetical protein
MGVLFSQLFCSEWSNFSIERSLGGSNGCDVCKMSKKEGKSKSPGAKSAPGAPGHGATLRHLFAFLGVNK